MRKSTGLWCSESGSMWMRRSSKIFSAAVLLVQLDDDGAVERDGVDTLLLASIVDVAGAVRSLAGRGLVVLGALVVENQTATALLDLGTRGTLEVVGHDGLDRLLPAGNLISVGHLLPCVLATVLEEAAVLGNEAKVRDAAEQSVKLFGAAAGHDVNGVALVEQQFIKHVQGALFRLASSTLAGTPGGSYLGADGNDLVHRAPADQGALVVQNEQPAVAALVSRGQGVDVEARDRGLVVLVLLVVHAIQAGQELAEPVRTGVVHDGRVQGAPPTLLLFVSHLERLLDGVGALPVVPGVDGKLVAAKERRCAGELGQNEGAVLLLGEDLAVLAEEVLVRGQVHALTLTGDHQRVGHGQQSKVLGVVDVLLEVDDRLVGQVRPGGVDSGDDVANSRVQVRLLAARQRHLDEDNLVTPFRVLVEEQLVRQQFLANAADVVELVASHNELLALVTLLHDLNPSLDVVVAAVVAEVDGVDADGQVDDIDKAVLQLEAVGGGLDVQQPAAGLEEVAGVLVDLEADQVGPQHALEELLAHGQTSEHLGRGKGDVQEEANLGVGQLLADHAGDEQQVVVVHPDDVAAFPVLDNLVGEGLVDVDVVLPRVVLEGLALGVVGDLVVEDGPQDLLAKVGVVAVKVLVGGEDGEHVMLGGEPVLDVLLLLRALEGVGGHAEGADPGVLSKLAVASGGLGGVAQAAVALVGVHDAPVGVGKDTVVAVASDERPGLGDALATQLPGLLEGTAVLGDDGGRGRARARLGLGCSSTPLGRALVDGGPELALLLGEYAEAILVREGVLGDDFLGRCDRGRDVADRVEETRLAVGLGALGLVCPGAAQRVAALGGAGQSEVDGFGEKSGVAKVRLLARKGMRSRFQGPSGRVGSAAAGKLCAERGHPGSFFAVEGGGGGAGQRGLGPQLTMMR
ncbi:LOW QUALITY PROTEIN: hypothetical protein ColTof3_10343 [Colletotrichum tofieldiae]|nr:LOW QUALITY PROTEIN: hypothetical protein ColTof3_10343 [Colletotrichum tofieldiae]